MITSRSLSFVQYCRQRSMRTVYGSSEQHIAHYNVTGLTE